MDRSDSIDSMIVNEVLSAVGLPPLEDEAKGKLLIAELRKNGETNV